MLKNVKKCWKMLKESKNVKRGKMLKNIKQGQVGQ